MVSGVGEILPDGSIGGYVCGCGAPVGGQGHNCEWRREQEAALQRRRELGQADPETRVEGHLISAASGASSFAPAAGRPGGPGWILGELPVPPQRVELGFATTTQLLNELQARFEFDQCPMLVEKIRSVRIGCTASQLDYRTVDS